MMKKWLSAALAALLVFTLLAGCANDAASASVSSSASSAAKSEDPEMDGPYFIAGLKGPTSMGMVKLMEDEQARLTNHSYALDILGTADEIVPQLTAGDIDMAAVPANLASVLYNNTNGGIQVAAINTLGVLYVVETGETIQSIEDLRGKTIYSTGKGTTPEFALNYILQQNGIDPVSDITIEYKSESTEIAALLSEGTDAIAVLPQPYVTAVQAQNENVRIALDLTEEWNKVSPDSALVTGVLVARTEFIEEHKDDFDSLLSEYKASIEWTNENVPQAAELIAQYGIVEKAPIAEKALPLCNVTDVDGAEMKQMLSGYLQVLREQEPKAVGGQLPDDAFYYGA